MRERNPEAKNRIVSARVSAEEWDILCQTMEHLAVDNISDLMRVALKRLTGTSTLFDGAPAGGVPSGKPPSAWAGQLLQL